MYITGHAVAFAPSEATQEPLIMRFAGGRAVKGEGELPLGGFSSYFAGREEKDWRSGIPHFGRVRYKGLYHGVDLVYYPGKGNCIEGSAQESDTCTNWQWFRGRACCSLKEF